MKEEEKQKLKKIFRGFIVTRNKAATHTYDKAKNLEEVQGFEEYAGLLKEEYLILDVDNNEQAEKIFEIVKKEKINCRVVRTVRGKHFYFRDSKRVKKSSTNIMIACGCVCDIKLGRKNGYCIVKMAGKMRKVEYDMGVEYDPLPIFFHPTSYRKTKFLGMKDGDGRNQALFEYILALLNHGYNRKEIKDILRIINKYIFAESLDEEEMAKITRDEAFKKGEKKKSGQKHEKKIHNKEKIAEEIIRERKLIKIRDDIYVYESGIYTNEKIKLEKNIFAHIPHFGPLQRQEILDVIRYILDGNEKEIDTKYIPFQNGLYDTEKNELIPHTPNIITTNKVEWDYNPDSYSEEIDESLDKLANRNKEIRANLEELIGYIFYKGERTRTEKAIILKGEGNNGKSSFISLLQAILGLKNYSSVPFQQLGHRFKGIRLKDKLANITDEIGSNNIKDPMLFKTLVTRGVVENEWKGRNSINFRNYARLIASCNKIPRMGSVEESKAIIRRLYIIPFRHVFKSGEIPPKGTKKNIEYLIKLGIAGLQRMFLQKGFTTSEKVAKFLAYL